MKNDKDTCREIQELYKLFQDLISLRKFANNDFMKLPDALAVIDLAEACHMYEKTNKKAAGVCYNNMANIQFKSGKYILAADNFNKAIELVENLL